MLTSGARRLAGCWVRGCHVTFAGERRGKRSEGSQPDLWFISIFSGSAGCGPCVPSAETPQQSPVLALRLRDLRPGDARPQVGKVRAPAATSAGGAGERLRETPRVEGGPCARSGPRSRGLAGGADSGVCHQSRTHPPICRLKLASHAVRGGSELRCGHPGALRWETREGG